VLQACVQLDLFAALAEGPQDGAALAARMDLPATEANRLLQAAAALDLVARRGGGRYGLGRLGAALVQAPGLLAMIRHHAMLYDDLRDPVALLRRRRADTRLGAYWDYGPRGDSAAYTDLMAASQPMVAAQVLGAVDLRRYRCLLDVGGGDGSFLLEVARVAPGLRLMLADLPGVAEAARTRLGDRASVHGVVLPGALPPGADIVSLVRVLHDHDDDMALRILGGVRAALPAGGTVLVAEPMAGAPGAARVGAYFAMYLLAMGRGRPRTPQELASMLRAAGFERPRLRRTVSPMVAQVLMARAA
jgi:demethylspheroidene O-methyltransferase